MIMILPVDELFFMILLLPNALLPNGRFSERRAGQRRWLNETSQTNPEPAAPMQALLHGPQGSPIVNQFLLLSFHKDKESRSPSSTCCMVFAESKLTYSFRKALSIVMI